MLDKSSIIGLAAGFGLVVFAIVSEGSLVPFMSLSSIFIVGGGVIASTMVNYSFTDIKESFPTIVSMIKAKDIDLRTDIELMNLFAKRSRRDGLLQLENDISEIDDGFLRGGLQLAVDGVKKENLEEILSDQIQAAKGRIEMTVNLLYSMAGYAPAFGMVGTVIGMVLMLQNISDAESLGKGLSVALLTTLYGAVLANLVFTPLAGKLDYLSELDINRKLMFRSAILSMVEQENPRIMEKKMLNYVDPRSRAEYLKYYDTVRSTKEREEKLYRLWKNQQNSTWDDLRKILEVG
ncbi:MAG: flagellar motor stator protein MotA [Bacteroidetes bacterium HLUCCA01]|nr:MAG: flagellar motor stator protein MotA [Bacteroidetes bacterium HLUCCA01]